LSYGRDGRGARRACAEPEGRNRLPLRPEATAATSLPRLPAAPKIP